LNNPLQIGITGNIGSGKSLICRIFQCLGVPVYDADSHAKELMTTDGILVSNIKKEFGALSFSDDGSLDRKYLGFTVFNDPAKLKKLNAMVHPRVKEDYEAWVTRHQTYAYVLKEAALLYEAGSAQALDKVIVVDAPETLRVSRVLIRDPHRTAEQVRGIEANQMPAAEKVKKADFVINNDEKVLLIPQVLELHNRLLSLCR